MKQNNDKTAGVTGMKNALLAAVVAAGLLVQGCTAGDIVKEDIAENNDRTAAVSAASETGAQEAGPEEAYLTSEGLDGAPKLAGLTCRGKMILEQASCFDVYYYTDGFKVLRVYADQRDSAADSGSGPADYLLVPEGSAKPDGLDSEITVIQQPLDALYVAATSSMCFFSDLESMDAVKMTGTDRDGWYIDAPKEALEAGTLLYAGKYSEPDYELMVGKGCDLAIESTMILHSPEVQEMIESLSIPVFIDRASYEPEPMGRTEWIKLYGAMMGKEEAAFDYFNSQKDVISDLEGFQNTGKTVTYFTVSSNKNVVVRKADDYIPHMIEQAGGVYTFQDMEAAGESAAVNMSMEQFYSDAVDSDYMVYNATIEQPLEKTSDLTDKDALFGEFKAVQEGNVWQIDRAAYQSADRISYMIRDFHIMLTDGDQSRLTFLSKVPD